MISSSVSDIFGELCGHTGEQMQRRQLEMYLRDLLTLAAAVSDGPGLRFSEAVARDCLPSVSIIYISSYDIVCF